MAAIGWEVRLMYDEIVAGGCQNILPQFCAGWTSRATRARKMSRRHPPRRRRHRNM
jgi:hypothetical protein